MNASNQSPQPRHSAAVEHVAKEIIIWSIVAATICTLVVMMVNI